MPPRKKLKSAPPVIGVDRFGALPDHMLHHVLSFLPAQAAVQTCVLARRWRDLWKSSTGLRIVGLDDLDELSVQDIHKFVDYLLILRDRTDLDTVQIKLDEFSKEDQPYVNLWVRYAVMCKARALTVHITDGDLCLDDLPLVSRHMKTLELSGVALRKTFLDFASCPALEDLKMTDCGIEADMISSVSLKHLSISDCDSDLDCRIRVSTPGLVSLKLVGFAGRTPVLENMALLETAYVDLGPNWEDGCLHYDSHGVFCGANNNACENCVRIEDGYSSDCVLLGGISSARNLALLSESRMLYSKGPNHEVELKGSYTPMEGPSIIPEHLNIVEVKCNVVDKRVLKVLKFLSACNIRFSFE
uniref:Uncharacterized protein n=1 Tax=Avena sativa TaxID=4498 RepID=A0ACD5V815_AVESA